MNPSVSDPVEPSSLHSSPASGERSGVPARVHGANALGALALGAIAVGALAIGALAIGRLAIGRTRMRHVEIDELVVGKLRVTEDLAVGDDK